MELWDRLLQMLRLHRRRPGPVRLTLLTREGCHLCEDAGTLLHKLRTEFAFEIDAIDVDADEHAALRSEHGDRVPVILVNGRARLWGQINAVLLRRLLVQECQRQA